MKEILEANDMVQLTDYLYSGHTVLRILYNYAADLQKGADRTYSEIDKIHADFLLGMADVLEHNDFLTSQSMRIREFYKYMAKEYPQLAFTFRGRVKSLIRSERKFNGYIVELVYDQHEKTGEYPDVEQVRSQIGRFHDFIAYRIVISIPRCHLKKGDDRALLEEACLYEIANVLPDFLKDRGFAPQPCGIVQKSASPLLDQKVRPYYRDYIVNQKGIGYRSLHITFYDTVSSCYTEVQLRTQEMDDYAEIGEANHTGYERRQEQERLKRDAIPKGECPFFDEAYTREESLQSLDLSKVDVNMFSALDNYRINDGCGLYRGRLILPLEHLSRFQNDVID